MKKTSDEWCQNHLYHSSHVGECGYNIAIGLLVVAEAIDRMTKLNELRFAAKHGLSMQSREELTKKIWD